MRVAKAESKVHNKPLEEIHFHEVGAIDSIVDIIGTAILINRINPDKIIASVVNDGEMEQPNEDFAVMETNVDDCSGEILGYW